MHMMTHIMVDLETFGKAPNALFPSLAAVQFDLLTGETGHRFSMTVDIDSALDAGMVVDGSTMAWWLKQDANASNLMFVDPQPLKHVLMEFKRFLIECSDGLESQDQLTMWGNSASFDLTKIAWAFKATGLTKEYSDHPWSPWNEKCFRTYTKMFTQFGNDVKKADLKHDPIQDCDFQIRKLCEVYSQVQTRLSQHQEVDAGYTEAILLLHDISQLQHLSVDMRERIQLFMDGNTTDVKAKVVQDMKESDPDDCIAT